MASARETMEQLLDAVLHVKSAPEFKVKVTAALEVAFQDVSDAAWRHALERFAGDLEKGLIDAHGAGCPPNKAFANVPDLILAARVLAGRPPRLPARKGS